jgi:integrase/recombinase XerD
MTPLRQRMIQDMQLRGFSARTQECYAAAVGQLAQHFHTSPDRLTEEHLRQYFLYLANEKRVARATATIALCGIKFFYQQTLQRPWPTLQLIRPPREKKLPVVLSREEVRRALGAVRIPVYRACLTAIYAGGLRLLEGARLQVPDIDSDRLLFHIHGKAHAGPLILPRGPHAGGGGHFPPPWRRVSRTLR